MAIDTPAQAVKTILENSSEVASGTDIYVGRLPEEVDTEILALFDSGGFPPEPAYLRDDITVQAVTRGAPQDYAGPWNLQNDVKNAILGLDSQVVNGITYVRFLMMTDIAFIGYDSKNRASFTTNWRIHVEKTSGGQRSPL